MTEKDSIVLESTDSGESVLFGIKATPTKLKSLIITNCIKNRKGNT